MNEFSSQREIRKLPFYGQEKESSLGNERWWVHKTFSLFQHSLETLSSSSLKRYTLAKCEDRELSYWPTVTCFSLIAQISEFPKPESSTKTKGDGKITVKK